MISRASRRRCILEAEARQIQFVDEDIDHAYRVVPGHVIINAIVQKQLLPSVTALDETSHFGASCNAKIIAYQAVFTQPRWKAGIRPNAKEPPTERSAALRSA